MFCVVVRVILVFDLRDDECRVQKNHEIFIESRKQNSSRFVVFWITVQSHCSKSGFELVCAIAVRTRNKTQQKPAAPDVKPCFMIKPLTNAIIQM